MKTFKTLLGMTVLAMMAASCSNDLADVQAPEQASEVGGIHFTATIAPKSFDATTRALVEDTENGVLHSNWAVGEAIIMNYNVKQGDFEKNRFAKAVVTAVNPTTGAATIEANLAEGAIDGSEISMSYPEEGYTMANEEVQDGTLSGKMDVRRGKGTIEVNGTEATLASGAKLDAVYAIVKFTTKNMAGDLLETQRLYIGDCDGETFISIFTNDDEIYAALPPTNEYTNTLWFDVWDHDGDPYITKGTANLEAGKFYEVELKMATVGDVILSNGAFAAPKTRDAVAMIAYLDGDAETTTHGLAVALGDLGGSTEYSWDNSGTNNGGKTAAELVANWASSNTAPVGTWCLPSAYDWQHMFIGCGSASKYVTPLTDAMRFDNAGFSEKLFNAGGSDASVKLWNYWSSTEQDSDKAWYFYFREPEFNYNSKKGGCYIRAVLAF